MKKPFRFSVDGKFYSSKCAELTGAQIKARIATLDSQFILVREDDDEIGTVIGFDDRTPIAGRKFHTYPPCTYA